MAFPKDKAEDVVRRLQILSPEERDSISLENVRRTEAEHQKFLADFKFGKCYICDKPIKTFSNRSPCLHWLLKPKGFRKHDLLAVTGMYGLFQIQTYLRWVANTEGLAKNINDLAEEGTGKLIELTIRYRNLEWSFSLGESDYFGHHTSQHAKDPHYHFQMRIDRHPFINYNDFHIPLSEGDILSIEAHRNLPEMVKHKFPGGEGMADILNAQTAETLVRHGVAAGDEHEAMLTLDTLIMADEGTTISGNDLYNLIQEAKKKKVTVSSLMHKLPNAHTQVYITPGPGVVAQASRSGRKKNT